MSKARRLPWLWSGWRWLAPIIRKKGCPPFAVPRHADSCSPRKSHFTVILAVLFSGFGLLAELPCRLDQGQTFEALVSWIEHQKVEAHIAQRIVRAKAMKVDKWHRVSFLCDESDAADGRHNGLEARRTGRFWYPLQGAWTLQDLAEVSPALGLNILA